jgi:(1->4)-alpha-D-glucan 1-alpha-D-glucosylmutase
MPGVPDVYQGSELWETSLVDPDNRRPVDFDLRRRMLREVDAGFDRGELPPVDETAAAKLLVTSRALRLRRDRPEWFTRYRPLSVVDAASRHAVAFDRGGAVTVATRLPIGIAARAGAAPAAPAPPEAWDDTCVITSTGSLVDAITGRRYEGGAIPLAGLLATYPVALLVPADAEEAR